MPQSTTARIFEVRHLQLARAAFAAIAAIMIAFSADHSASVGLAVFSGWAIATGLVELLAAWLVYRPAEREWTGTRWPAVVLGLLTVVAGMIGGIVGIRSTLTFFVVVVAWALLSGVFEAGVALAAGRADRRRSGRTASDSRDGVVVGAVTVLLGIGTLAIPVGYHLDYTIAAAGQTFTLTGIAIAVGVFGGYAAIVAVYLGIAGLSPRRMPVQADAATTPAAAGPSATSVEERA